MFKKSWTPAEAQRWTGEDYLAMILSVMTYFGLGIGTPVAFFHWSGYVFLALGGLSGILLTLVIDPKLKAISSDFEEKQQQYLEDLQKIMRWED